MPVCAPNSSRLHPLCVAAAAAVRPQWFMDGGVVARVMGLVNEAGQGEPGATLRVKVGRGGEGGQGEGGRGRGRKTGLWRGKQAQGDTAQHVCAPLQQTCR